MLRLTHERHGRTAETMEIVAEERTSDHPMIINGELVQGSTGLSDPVINPATGEVFDYVPHGTREDLDRAVDAAAEAFKTWSTTPFEERAACLTKFSELVEAKAEDLAKAMTMEQGKPIGDSLREVMGICSKCKEFLEIGDLKSETVSEDKDAEYKIVYSPRGVIGGITPWNVRAPHPPSHTSPHYASTSRWAVRPHSSADVCCTYLSSRSAWRRTSCCHLSSPVIRSSSSPPPTPRSRQSCSLRWPPRRSRLA
jgi:acyl-CoA reductase-like NAD-dependent aldehyde dehydrogenase